MLPQVLEYIQPKNGEVYVDGTFGAGGYSRALLEAANCMVYAIDRDPDVAVTAKKLMELFPNRFFWLTGNFSDMVELLAEQGIDKVDGIVLDIGVSSMQIDNAERGFSFRHNAALDMRMSKNGRTAADIINNYDEEELANIIYKYGDERKSRHIANAIIKERANGLIKTTSQLAEIVRRVVRGGDGIDPATRTFQALRIEVNDELGELERALSAAELLLKPSGRLVVVTFHSLEDRIVKNFFKSRSGETRGVSRHLPSREETHGKAADRLPAFFLMNKKAVLPDKSEISQNSRSRSAKLRSAIRSEAL
ncbi:MAG: 16S rRNA (cytosine(1402)-N(4))-methyltransferase RsmH [Pseudomonadota bacterium]